MKRVKTECGPWHFKQVMRLTGDSTEILWSKMTKPQRLATRVLVKMEKLGISSSQIENFKRVLLWEDDNGNKAIEYILYQPDSGFVQMITSMIEDD